jgi:ABC-2 type transport system permease protein
MATETAATAAPQAAGPRGTGATVGTTGPRPARSPATVVAGRTARAAARSGVAWGAVFAVSVASSAVSYSSLYPHRSQREALAAAYGTNQATTALFGPAPHLDTVAGFTAFKASMTLMVLGAVWGLLTSTRLLRGEEDQGRWEVLVAGPTTPRRATAQAVAGLGGGVAVLWCVTAAGTALVGRDAKVAIHTGAACWFALAMVATAAVFVGVGGVTSQLAATRRQAAGWAATTLGIAYAVRMVADAGVGLHGLIWASPLGWVEELGALTDPRPLALIPLVAATAILAGATVHLAGRRDVGSGLVADRDRARPRLGLLWGPTGLAARVARPTVVAWWAAITVSGLLYGLIARSAGRTITGSSVHQVLSRLGATGSGSEAVLGIAFLVLAVLVAFVAAGQVTAARGEESSGRLDNLLTRPVARTGWLGGRLGLAVAVVVVAGLLGGLGAWLGAASQHAGVRFGAVVAAGLNLAPPALVVLGLGVLALGLAPRVTSPVVYTYLTWSLLVVVVGGVGDTSHWVLDTSVFHQMAAAPAVPVDWTADLAMVAVAAVLTATGLLGFHRRDLAGD